MSQGPPSVNPSAHVVRIEGVPRGDGIAVVFAGPIVGMLTHWASGRSHACSGPSKCVPAVHRGRTVWKGYAPVRRWSAALAAWVPSVLEVTESLEEILRGRNLRGEMWHLVRAASNKKSAQVTGVFYSIRTEPELLIPFDVIAPIQRLYHSTDLDLGVANPLPSKVMVPTVSCAGPTSEEIGPRGEERPPTPDQIEALRKLSSRVKTQFDKRREFAYGSPTNGTNGKEEHRS